MPTGYTACVVDGDVTTFPEFAMTCARAFGSFIHMRDEGLDVPLRLPPKPKLDVEALNQRKKELERLEAMTPEEAEAFGMVEQAKSDQQKNRWHATRDLENARLRAMCEKVETWTPPTPEHENFKKFMLEQLAISMHQVRDDEKQMPPLERYKNAVERKRHSIEREQQRYAMDLQRWQEACRWIQQMMDSLHEWQAENKEEDDAPMAEVV